MPFGHEVRIEYLKVSTRQQQRSGLGLMQRAAIGSFLTAYGWKRLGRSIRDRHASASTGISALAAWRFGGFRLVGLLPFPSSNTRS